MLKILFLLFSGLFLSCSEVNEPNKKPDPQNNLKKIRGWVLEGKDTTEAVLIEYDSLGRVTLDSQPFYYCGTSYTYDTKSRVVEEENFCGESSGNGTTSYTYMPDGYISTFSGGIHEVTNLAYFDKDENLVKQLSDYNYLGNDPEDKKYHIYTESKWYYVFDSKKRTVQVKQTEWNVEVVSENKKRTREEKKEYITCFAYNEFDSLICTIDLNENGVLSRRHSKVFDPKSHLLIHEYDTHGDIPGDTSPPDSNNEIFRHTLYRYEKDGSLWKKEELEFCGKEKTVKETYYKNGLPEIEKSINCEDLVYQVIHFEYEYRKKK